MTNVNISYPMHQDAPPQGEGIADELRLERMFTREAVA